MTFGNLRQFPKTAAPLADELLSSWIRRLACANYCEVREVLQHIGFPELSNSALDLPLPIVRAEALALAGRVSTEHIRKMALQGPANQATPFIASQPFQDCPACRDAAGIHSFELRHWRFAWSLFCERCGGQLTPRYRGRANPKPVTEKLIRKAGQGAELLASAAKSNREKDLRRIQTALRFSSAYLCIHGPTSVLFSSNYYDRLFCLAAISEAQNNPIAKAARLIANSSFTARNRVYQAFEKEFGLRQKITNLGSKMERFADTKTLGQGLLNDLPINPSSKSKTKYEHAALQAIAELGSGADRKKLLRRADQLLNAH